MPKLRQPTAKPEDEISKVDPNQQELELTADDNDPEIEIVEENEVSQDDAALALQKQIDDLKKSEKIQRDRADKADSDRREALAKAQERETQIARFQKEAKESQFDAINSALAAANAEAEKAQQDIENAIANGDARLQAEAYRRLARAETNILRLEDGKTEVEAQFKAEPKRETQAQQQSGDPLERTNLPSTAKDWLRAHPEYLTDNRKNAKIQALHWDVVDEGHAPFSTEYFESLEQHLGLRQAEQVERIQQPAQRTNIVSAPVSRGVPNGTATRSNSKITLTAMQKEAAKMAGISETEYAKQLIKLNELKANGQYSGGGN